MVARSVAHLSRLRWLVAALAVVGVLVVAPSAQAAITSVYGGAVNCTPVAPTEIRECNGSTLTWDGATKVDVNVFLPPETGGAEGPYPLIGDFHGWGGAKQGLNTVPLAAPEPEKATPISEQEDPRILKWAAEGYAVFSMSDRGWGLSCGKEDPDAVEPECAQGWNHLMDDRYEVRDAQYLMSVLADEGVAAPRKIGVTGQSYGGGISIALGALRDREMLPGGALVPWTSPDGTAMEIAAAVPQWAWSDIAYALAPNGRNLDYVTDSTYRGPSGKAPIGVMKYSYTEGLYKTGDEVGRYNPDENDPADNVKLWRERLRGGEPYTDPLANGMIEELSTYHSAFGIDHSQAPAPMLLQSGWNDDLFPVDEALRFYQRTRALFPGAPISLFLADYGHSRSQNKKADVAAFNQRLEAWFAHYLKGEGAAPSSSVEALTTDCTSATESEGPYTAAGWSGLQPGEINFASADARTIGHGTPAEEEVPTTSGLAFDPIVGPGNPCVALPVAAVENPRAVGYSLAPAPAGGFTLMGSPTIVATVRSPSPNSEIAARLLDVSPEGTESLLARGLYRPVGGTQQIVFQLHPQAYHVPAGHVVKLELLPSDLPYGRFSNLQTKVTVSNLELRLPVMEQPGSLGGLVRKPAPKVVPAGYRLAAEFEEEASGGGTVTPPPPPPAAPVSKVGAAGLTGRLTANRKALIVPLHCTGEGACSGWVWAKAKRPGKKGRVMLARGQYSIAAGQRVHARIPLTKSGRHIVKLRFKAKRRRARTFPSAFKLNDSGRVGTLALKRRVHLKGGH